MRLALSLLASYLAIVSYAQYFPDFYYYNWASRIPYQVPHRPHNFNYPQPSYEGRTPTAFTRDVHAGN